MRKAGRDAALAERHLSNCRVPVRKVYTMPQLWSLLVIFQYDDVRILPDAQFKAFASLWFHCWLVARREEDSHQPRLRAFIWSGALATCLPLSVRPPDSRDLGLNDAMNLVAPLYKLVL